MHVIMVLSKRKSLVAITTSRKRIHVATAIILRSICTMIAMARKNTCVTLATSKSSRWDITVVTRK